MKDIKKKIKKLTELILANSNKPKKERGFPVAAMLWVKKKGVIGFDINRKSEVGIGNHDYHSETLLVKQLESEQIKNKKIKALIVLPPCRICLDRMLEFENSWRIFYLTDSIRNKTSKDYLNNEKISVEKLVNKKHYDLETKICISYLIVKANEVALNHRGNTPEEITSMNSEINTQLKEVENFIGRLAINDENWVIKGVYNYFKDILLV